MSVDARVRHHVGLRERLALPAAAGLDALAVEIFSGSEGAPRIDALRAQFDREVGALLSGDEDLDLLHMVRSDWALCDAWLEGGPGDTWAYRAARGQVPGLAPEPAFERIAASFSGLFEVWPGRQTWLRCRLSGRCVQVVDRLWGLPAPADEPAALWEIRVVPVRNGVRVCRPALVYPIELIERLELDRDARARGEPEVTMQVLRKARLEWVRARRKIPFSSRLDSSIRAAKRSERSLHDPR